MGKKRNDAPEAAASTETQQTGTADNASQLSAAAETGAEPTAQVDAQGAGGDTGEQTSGSDETKAEESSAEAVTGAEAPAADAEPTTDAQAGDSALQPTQAPAIDPAAVQAVLQAETAAVEAAVEEAKPVSAEATQLTIFKQQFENYLRDFAPGVPHHDAAQSASRQLRLARMLRDAPVQLGEYFPEAYSWALAKIHESAEAGGAFHDDYVFRFYDHPRIRNNPEDRDNTAFLISFLKTVANAQTRKMVLKQIDIPRVLKIFGSEEAARKIHNYFNMG